jgi:hypothetical protein
MAVRSNFGHVRRLLSGSRHARGVASACGFGRVAVTSAALCLATLLASASGARAGGPAISGVAFTGSSADLHVVISGTGFGMPPKGVPCNNCTTPYLRITNGRGGCQLFDITSWSDKSIVFDGFQGNPGDSVLMAVINPQDHLAAIRGQTTIPSTITPFNPPHISSVRFEGSVDKNLIMSITGRGFGASPPGVPFSGNLPFFAFVDRPFSVKKAWVAGFGADGVTLNYALWSNKHILVVGFGSGYGHSYWRVHPGDAIEVAVSNTNTCGLNINTVNGVTLPTAIGAVWGGHLR